VFEPVAPTAPVDVVLTQVQPFTFDSPSSFRPNGPTSLLSGEYAADFNEVKAYGRSDSAVRTPEQTQTVRFWAENTFVQLGRTLRLLAEERELNVRESARLLGFVHVATADAMIACFEAKYYFSFWRPFHAIDRADTDGNRATTPDPTWTSFLVVNQPRLPIRPFLLPGRRDRGARDLLRDQRDPTHDLQHLRRSRAAPHLRAAQ